MSALSKPGVTFVIGLAVGGLFGGIAGFVVNDLSEREDPEAMQQIEEAEQVQEDLDDFFNSLGSTPAATQGAAEGSE